MFILCGNSNPLLSISAARHRKTDHAAAAAMASDCSHLPPSPRPTAGESAHPYPMGYPGPIAASGRHQHTNIPGMRSAPPTDNPPLWPHTSSSRPPRSSSVPASPHASNVGAPSSIVVTPWWYYSNYSTTTVALQWFYSENLSQVDFKFKSNSF
jgi:hypothetical protein